MTSSLIRVGKVFESRLQFTRLFIFEPWNPSLLLFFSLLAAKFVRGQDPKPETAEEGSLRRHRASSEKQRDSVLCM